MCASGLPILTAVVSLVIGASIGTVIASICMGLARDNAN